MFTDIRAGGSINDVSEYSTKGLSSFTQSSTSLFNRFCYGKKILNQEHRYIRT